MHQNQWLALLGWSAAALKCKVRDQWIGWPSFFQYQRLSFLANNSRFLILPHVRIPNLASYVLAQNLKRLSRDWQAIYNHPIYLAETFVDPQYFKGTCYKAQGWEFLGYTRGFAKCANRYYPHNQPKMVFVRLVLPDGKRKLSEPYYETQNTPQETKPMRLSLKDAESLKERLSQIPDPRMPRGKRHRKLSVMTISLCALLCSATSFASIAQWAKSCSQNMLKSAVSMSNRRLGCRFNPKTRTYEPPSEPTIRRFLQDVDAEAVDAALYGWLQSLSREDTTLAIDGKTLNGAYQENGRKIHLLSAFLQQKGVVIAQCPVDSKTNEIPELKTLCGITSLTPHKADPSRILQLNRGHWSIENSLHYVRDVTFREDHSSIRTNHAPRVMASLRNCIISIFRSLGKTAIAQTLRTMTYKPHLALKLLRL